MSNNLIGSAELKWKNKIIRYISALYKGHWLPSHDISHHQRVWENACELCSESESQSHDEYFYEKLIIACFFHDTGLLKDRSEIHGRFSREFCEVFLSENAELIHFEINALLEAIEYHDDKSYEGHQHRNSDELYKLLAIADDLDALGAIGVYRYIEIYLLREINRKDIPAEILSNVKLRFDNFRKSKYYSKKNRKNYDSKYSTIASLLNDDSFKEESVTLVNWVNDKIVIPGRDPFRELNKLNLGKINNRRIEAFVSSFKNEIENSE